MTNDMLKVRKSVLEMIAERKQLTNDKLGKDKKKSRDENSNLLFRTQALSRFRLSLVLLLFPPLQGLWYLGLAGNLVRMTLIF